MLPSAEGALEHAGLMATYYVVTRTAVMQVV